MIYTTIWLEFWTFLFSIIIIVIIHELGHLFVMTNWDNNSRIVFDKKKKAIYTTGVVDDRVYKLSLYTGIAFGGFAVIPLSVMGLYNGWIFYPLAMINAYFFGIIDDIKAINKVNEVLK